MVRSYDLYLADIFDLLIVCFGRLYGFRWTFRFDQNQRKFGIRIVVFLIEILLVVQLLLEFIF